MQHLRQLLGDDVVNELSAPVDPDSVKDLSFVLTASGKAWDDWRRKFDEALGLIEPLLTTTADRRDRRKILVAKLRHNFWSTVPEVFWAGRMRSFGWSVEIEPQAKGPDFSFTDGSIDGVLEVYSPVNVEHA